jgi:hypothetical protein
MASRAWKWDVDVVKRLSIGVIPYYQFHRFIPHPIALKPTSVQYSIGKIGNFILVDRMEMTSSQASKRGCSGLAHKRCRSRYQ